MGGVERLIPDPGFAGDTGDGRRRRWRPRWRRTHDSEREPRRRAAGPPGRPAAGSGGGDAGGGGVRRTRARARQDERHGGRADAGRRRPAGPARLHLHRGARAAWNPEARPVPVAARLAAQSAVQEEAAALVVDIAGPGPSWSRATTCARSPPDGGWRGWGSARHGWRCHDLRREHRIVRALDHATSSSTSSGPGSSPASAGVLTLEQAKLRAWAGVWRVTTVDGVFYAKQNSDGQAFEAALVAELAALAPDHVVPVAAVDTARGLLLTADQGPVFAETIADDDLDAWCRLVSRAMELARIVAPAMPVMTAAGLSEAPPHPSVAAEIERGRRRSACPITLSHNDLHGHNAFDIGQRPALLRLRRLGRRQPAVRTARPAQRGGLLPRRARHPTTPRLRRVADAALEVWSDVAPIDGAAHRAPSGAAAGSPRVEPSRGAGSRQRSRRRTGPNMPGMHQQWIDMLPEAAPVQLLTARESPDWPRDRNDRLTFGVDRSVPLAGPIHQAETARSSPTRIDRRSSGSGPDQAHRNFSAA